MSAERQWIAEARTELLGRATRAPRIAMPTGRIPFAALEIACPQNDRGEPRGSPRFRSRARRRKVVQQPPYAICPHWLM